MTIEETRKTQFKQWFMRRWSAWDHDRGQRSTQLELAEYLGITRSAVAQYVAGNHLPEGDSLRKIASKFGMEIYSILGVGVPLDMLPPEFASRLASLTFEIANTLAETKTDLSTDEAEKVAREIASRSGLISSDTV